jgi:hypothetical protein
MSSAKSKNRQKEIYFQDAMHQDVMRTLEMKEKFRGDMYYPAYQHIVSYSAKDKERMKQEFFLPTAAIYNSTKGCVTTNRRS